MGQAVCARAPARIDFAGGWTDVAEYAHDPPGVVLNVAITLHAYAVVRPRGAADRTVRICSADFDRCVEAAAPEGLEYDGTLDLLKYEYFERLTWAGGKFGTAKSPTRAELLKNKFIQERRKFFQCKPFRYDKRKARNY